MKFAFLVHPLTEETRWLSNLDQGSKGWVSQDLIGLVQHMHRSIHKLRNQPPSEAPPSVRVVDELLGLVSTVGAEAEGRLYEIPMDAYQILEDP
ncbi:MAG: hypothetical protein HQ582_13220, partial [Planctomycetes bacterium]|nr:hypothetical protein [Planctomycetota bacterium]